MKSKLLALALGLTVSLSALASPVVSLPGGPLFVKFTGAEQIAVGGANTGAAYGNANEISWGVFVVTTMDKGTVVTPNASIGGGDTFFVNKLTHNAQITGMFYGIEAGSPATVANPLPGKKGFMDLYWRDLGVLGETTLSSMYNGGAGVRNTLSTATGFTDGTLLAHIEFTAGIDPTNPTVTVSGSVLPTSGGFSGQSDFFANIDTTVLGAWTTQLATDYFTTAFGQADLKFKNSYNYLSQWDGGPGVFGAKLDDPAQAMAIPEPSVLALMGLAMFGMGMVRRRRNG